MLAWRHGLTTMTMWHAKHWLFTNLTNFARLGSALARRRAGLDLVGRNRGHTANVHAAHKEFKIYFLIPSKYVIAGYYIQQYTRDTGYMNWKYCDAQGKGRGKGCLRKVTQRSFIDYRWWISFPWCFTLNLVVTHHLPPVLLLISRIKLFTGQVR